MDGREEKASALSVIIPTLDEARSIGSTLDALARAAACAELIVVNGGGRGRTARGGRARGGEVVEWARGRGRQRDAGARAAEGHALWFLHADTLPSEDCAGQIEVALSDPSVVA